MRAEPAEIAVVRPSKARVVWVMGGRMINNGNLGFGGREQ
jgi:hypothetical protein